MLPAALDLTIVGEAIALSEPLRLPQFSKDRLGKAIEHGQTRFHMRNQRYNRNGPNWLPCRSARLNHYAAVEADMPARRGFMTSLDLNGRADELLLDHPAQQLAHVIVGQFLPKRPSFRRLGGAKPILYP